MSTMIRFLADAILGVLHEQGVMAFARSRVLYKITFPGILGLGYKTQITKGSLPKYRNSRWAFQRGV